MHKKSKEHSSPKRQTKKPNGYWSYENTLSELSTTIAKMGHFPTRTELVVMKQGGLSHAINTHGGFIKFRELLGIDLLKKPHRYWTDEVIVSELKTIELELKHFPTREELTGSGRTGLATAIDAHGGYIKFRELFGYELLHKPEGYWTDEVIINELKKIETKLNHFPTQAELRRTERMGLETAINSHGGLNKFRELFGYKPFQKPDGYWTDEAIINELEKIESKLNHFPTQTELINMNRHDLKIAINTHGGLNKFRELLGYNFLKKPDGYWTDEAIIKELEKIESKLNHFPAWVELNNRQDLMGAINKNGGLLKFREALGYSISLYEQYRAESTNYNTRRGKKTELLVKRFLSDWCTQNRYPEPEYSKKLAKNNIIEFVCNTGKTIGVDVTNTKTLSGSVIRKKYRQKEYHKYLDELWIVVFSNVFEERDYRKFNNESPDNVRVMSIDVFLKELDISTEEHIISKINAYKNCTFRTKDEFVKRHLNKSLNDYLKVEQ